MQGRQGDKIRLQHILDAIREIENYTGKSGPDEFKSNSMMRFACIKQMEIIGEASNHISEETRTKFSDIEWAQVIGMRNVFCSRVFRNRCNRGMGNNKQGHSRPERKGNRHFV